MVGRRKIYTDFLKCKGACSLLKHKSEFNWRPNGYIQNYTCKDCDANRSKQWRIDNPSIVISYNAQYYKDNQQDLIDYQKKYYSNNTEKVKNYKQKYSVENKEKINKDKKEYIFLRRKNDIVFKIHENISCAIRYSVKSNKFKNGKSIKNILSYSIKELKDHLESQFESWMTWENWGIYNRNTWNDQDSSTWTWQIDHVIPKSNFKILTIDDEEFKKCWALENLRPLSAKQNIMDGNRRNK